MIEASNYQQDITILNVYRHTSRILKHIMQIPTKLKEATDKSENTFSNLYENSKNQI